MVSRIRLEIEAIIQKVTDKRAQVKRERIEKLKLPASQYQKALAQIAYEQRKEISLVNLRYENDIAELDNFFDSFFTDFYHEAHHFNPNLSVEEVAKMFFDFFEMLYSRKLTILDTNRLSDVQEQVAPFADIKHENEQLITWSKAQEKASFSFLYDLEMVFTPILENLSPTASYLFTGFGKIRAASAGGNIGDHPVSSLFAIFNEDFERLLMPSLKQKGHPDYKVDLGLFYLLWSALSSQYVRNSDRKNINVYLPEGEIATSSTFWNYELNVARQLNLEVGAKIHFYRLNDKAKKRIALMSLEITHLEKNLKKKTGSKAEQEELKVEKELLENERHRLYGDEKSWEEVPFEHLKFKGLVANKKPFTVGDLQKLSKALKKKGEEKKEKTAATSQKNVMTPMREAKTQKEPREKSRLKSVKKLKFRPPKT